jgi:DNA (cytosine-5)-methyltransferase 1
MLLAEADGGMVRDYQLSWNVMLAADYGVAQRRPRAILIGSRIGRIDPPAATHAKFPTGDLMPWQTVRSRIAGLPAKPDTTLLPKSSTQFFDRTVPGVFKGLDIHVGRVPRELSLRRYDCVPPGGGRFDLPDELLPDCWRNKRTGTTDVMGRMRWDTPSLTIRTEFFKPEKGQYLHPHWNPDDTTDRVNRPITHLEAARLQDFPEEFLWCGTKIQIAKQIGNAVPAGLARAIAEHLTDHLG